MSQELVFEGELQQTDEGLFTGRNRMDDNGNWIENERYLSGEVRTTICEILFGNSHPDEIWFEHSKERARIRISIEAEWLEAKTA
mgnify:CR=1 FL=1